MEQGIGVVEIVEVIVGLLLIAAATLALTRRLRLPFTICLVVIGVGLSALSSVVPRVFSAVHSVEISSTLHLAG